MDEIYSPIMTYKVIGHQWYWSYETTSTFDKLNFDAYMQTMDVDEKACLETMKPDYPFTTYMIECAQLLHTDEYLSLPVWSEVRLLITSADVLHSWAVPSFGVKMDAVPGRLNQIILNIYKPGLYYGQCSELCGVNHAYMPISINTFAF
jgi:heme/copper-type cytochrome/quinol oxidase subunit 2